MNIDGKEQQLQEMKNQVKKTEEELSTAKEQANCDHKWGDPERVYVEPKFAGYHMPKAKVYRWKRVCEKCGKKEETENYKEVITRIPKF
jgi:hypothetical protein